VGGGLIGIELAEMLRSRNILSLSARRKVLGWSFTFWPND
jgi:NADPH-dependent 2,4-dienoyl-CoA reductase/sulfur reductase-like enzyme